LDKEVSFFTGSTITGALSGFLSVSISAVFTGGTTVTGVGSVAFILSAIE
jgi:hypothetical protein